MIVFAVVFMTSNVVIPLFLLYKYNFKTDSVYEGFFVHEGILLGSLFLLTFLVLLCLLRKYHPKEYVRNKNSIIVFELSMVGIVVCSVGPFLIQKNSNIYAI